MGFGTRHQWRPLPLLGGSRFHDAHNPFMYTTCIHCHGPLGGNESIEALPIGRRVAFDAAKGRLWVVCRRCERWNLTPFDARWEALEQCERAFRDTRIRMSTENVGLARLRDGTDLVRIGAPQRPEFAAWRYGDQFGQRRKTQVMWLAGGLVVGVPLMLAGAGLLAATVGPALPFISIANSAYQLARIKRAQRQTILLDDGRRIAPHGAMKLVDMNVEERWGLEVGVVPPPKGSENGSRSWTTGLNPFDAKTVTVRGNDAMPILRRFLPGMNKFGASAAQVQDGIQLIEMAGGPEHFGAYAASQRKRWAAQSQFGDTGDLRSNLPVAARLAFEMSVNEDAERRALEGELTQLEAAWREAEALASISDGLTPIEKIERKLDALRARRR